MDSRPSPLSVNDRNGGRNGARGKDIPDRELAAGHVSGIHRPHQRKEEAAPFAEQPAAPVSAPIQKMASSLQQIVHRTQSPNGTARFSVTVSPMVFTSILAAAVCILVWCFYMGYMVGRGQNPEKHLEEIAGIIQSYKSTTAAPSTEQEKTQATAAEQGQPAAAQPAQAVQTAATTPQGAPVIPGVVVPGATPTSQTNLVSQPAESDKAAKEAAARDAKAKAATPAAAAPKEARYAYSFQLGTLANESDARAAASRCIKRGVHAVVQKRGKAWVVTASIRGTDKDAQHLKAVSKAAGMPSPSLISRKEIH